MTTSTLCLFFFLFSSLSALNTTNTIQTYCSTRCADYVGVCWNQTSTGCMACSSDMYQLNVVDGRCELLEQHQLVYDELKMEDMDLSGYEATSMAPVSCGGYTFSGAYGAGSYIRKQFDLSLTHYQVLIRFSLGLIGTWDGDESVHLTLDGQAYTPKIHCSFTSDLCSGSCSDCIAHISQTHSHTKASLSVEISVTTTQTDVSVQYWGIKELLIVERRCHEKCERCFGNEDFECLGCQEGFYLEGNKCVQECEHVTLTEARECVEVCPQGFYQEFSRCWACEEGCEICTPEQCTVWEDGRAGNQFWTQYILVWVLVTFISLIIILLICWKCALNQSTKVVNQNGIEERMVNESSENIGNTSENIGNTSTQQKTDSNNFVWPEVEPLQPVFRKRKRRGRNLPTSMTVQVPYTNNDNL